MPRMFEYDSRLKVYYASVGWSAGYGKALPFSRQQSVKLHKLVEEHIKVQVTITVRDKGRWLVPVSPYPLFPSRLLLSQTKLLSD